MTENEIINRLQLDIKSYPKHPAWKSFVIEMRDKQYGYEPLRSQWSFYKQGWEACEASISNKVISLFTKEGA